MGAAAGWPFTSPPSFLVVCPPSCPPFLNPRARQTAHPATNLAVCSPPTPQLLPVINEYYRYFKKGFPNNSSCCKKSCQARLEHTTTHHVRSLHFKEPEIAIDTMKLVVRLRDMYLHTRAELRRKGNHSKLPELWDNHKSCY